MEQPSSPVTSRQLAPHPRLREALMKHLSSPWQKPIADHSRRRFDELQPRVSGFSDHLILDSGCGTGMSTGLLAHRYPEHLVLGVDKSEARLERHSGDLPANALLVRMDLEDFWLLASAAGWRFARQCFLYPNPWPKPEQRLRRWAFHPIFPTALACGGTWELRTNWRVYAEELALAVEWAVGIVEPVTPWNPREPETLFERKYLASGHSLWRWEASIGNSGGSQPSQR